MNLSLVSEASQQRARPPPPLQPEQFYFYFWSLHMAYVPAGDCALGARLLGSGPSSGAEIYPVQGQPAGLPGGAQMIYASPILGRCKIVQRFTPEANMEKETTPEVPLPSSNPK